MLFRRGNYYWPGDLENTQQTSTTQNTDTHWVNDVIECQSRFWPTADDDKRIESVEHGREVSLESNTVHLDQRFNREQADKKHVRSR